MPKGMQSDRVLLVSVHAAQSSFAKTKVKPQFREASFTSSEWQAFCALSGNAQPKEWWLSQEEKTVIDGVVLLFSYEIREEENCFCLGLGKKRQALKGVGKETLTTVTRTKASTHSALWEG